MNVLIGIAVVVIIIIAIVMESDSVFLKVVVSCAVAAIAALLIYAITQMPLFLALAKICGVGVILTGLVGIVVKIFDG